MLAMVAPADGGPNMWRARIGRVRMKGGESVTVLGMPTRLDLDPQRVLAAAAERGLERVVLAGYTKDGEEYFASSVADGGDALWLLKRCERALLNNG